MSKRMVCGLLTLNVIIASSAFAKSKEPGKSGTAGTAAGPDATVRDQGTGRLRAVPGVPTLPTSTRGTDHSTALPGQGSRRVRAVVSGADGTATNKHTLDASARLSTLGIQVDNLSGVLDGFAAAHLGAGKTFNELSDAQQKFIARMVTSYAVTLKSQGVKLDPTKAEGLYQYFAGIAAKAVDANGKPVDVFAKLDGMINFDAVDANSNGVLDQAERSSAQKTIDAAGLGIKVFDIDPSNPANLVPSFNVALAVGLAKLVSGGHIPKEDAAHIFNECKL